MRYCSSYSIAGVKTALSFQHATAFRVEIGKLAYSTIFINFAY